MKLTTSLAASATLSTALAAPTATLVDRNNGNWMNGPLVTWTVTKFLVANNADNLSSNFAFFIEDSYNNTTPCYIPNAYPTGTSLNARCNPIGDNGPTSGSTIPYSINWIYEPNTDQAIMELYSNNTAAVFLYPKASNMLHSGMALDDNGPNAVQTLPDGVADVWPTSQAVPAPAMSTTQASSGVIASDVSQVVSVANEVVSDVSSFAPGVVADATSIAASITSMAVGATSTIASVVSSVVSKANGVASSVGADASSVVADASSMVASITSTATSAASSVTNADSTGTTMTSIASGAESTGMSMAVPTMTS